MNHLMAAVVHDIKNQLAELALRLEQRDDSQPEMEIAMNASRRLTELLLVQQSEAKLLQVNVDSVSPQDFLDMLQAEYHALFPQLTFSIETTDAPACAFFDDALVRLAIGNALHNACRHTRSRVQLSARQQGDFLLLEVCDDGEGYPEKILATRGKQPTASSGRGTGLGLYLAGKIAECHQSQGQHGAIELSNASEGQGAVFRMFLP